LHRTAPQSDQAAYARGELPRLKLAIDTGQRRFLRSAIDPKLSVQMIGNAQELNGRTSVLECVRRGVVQNPGLERIPVMWLLRSLPI
jgi:hypothetical protein